MASTVAALQAAPLPNNVASMKSLVADRSIQARFGGWHGGGWGHRGFGGWDYRGRDTARRLGVIDKREF
jgi:hypothetical protein